MKHFSPTLVLVVLMATASLLPRDGFGANITLKLSASSVSCYDFTEVTLEVHGGQAKNPFTDVVVDGSFARNGEPATGVEGFCDSQDGTIYRVRFMPSQPGAYSFTVNYTEAGGAKTEFKGTFEATDDRKKGILRVDPEYPFHFQYEGSKERFFWSGTTAYWLAGWDLENITRIVERLDRLKVTRVRSALSGRVKDGRAWFEDVFPSEKFSFLLNPWVAKDPDSIEKPEFDVTRFNVAFWRKFEHLLATARERDMVVSVIFYVDGARPGVDPFGKAGMGGEDERRYYRYAISRLAPYCNVMWDIANEYRLFRDDAWAEKMGSFVKAKDPYKHLASTHGHGDFRFGKSPWADFAMYQSWDESGGWEFMMNNREQQLKTGRPIPQVNEEYGYEDHYPQGWGGNRVAPARSADNRARLAWEMYMAGGYQTTGERANGGADGGGWINGRGNDSMTMLEQYGHIYDFFTSITWWELVPDTNLVTSVLPHPGAKGGKPKVMASRNKDGDLAAIYIRDGGVVSLKGELLKDQLKPLWFSPRDGGMRNARALREKVYRTPTAEDWVLLFRTPCNCSFRDFDNEFER